MQVISRQYVCVMQLSLLFWEGGSQKVVTRKFLLLLPTNLDYLITLIAWLLDYLITTPITTTTNNLLAYSYYIIKVRVL